MLTLISPVEIWAHRLPAGAKLGLLCAFTVLLFALKTPAALLIAAAATAALIASGGAAFAKESLTMLRPLWPFVLIVGLWHLWTNEPAQGASIVIRMITAVAAANFVTMTTRLTDMITVLETLTKPLARLGLSPRALALAVALTIRFIPITLSRMQMIRES